jgi:hypothetical protein
VPLSICLAWRAGTRTRRTSGMQRRCGRRRRIRSPCRRCCCWAPCGSGGGRMPFCAAARQFTWPVRGAHLRGRVLHVCPSLTAACGSTGGVCVRLRVSVGADTRRSDSGCWPAFRSLAVGDKCQDWRGFLGFQAACGESEGPLSRVLLHHPSPWRTSFLCCDPDPSCETPSAFLSRRGAACRLGFRV